MPEAAAGIIIRGLLIYLHAFLHKAEGDPTIAIMLRAGINGTTMVIGKRIDK